MEYKHMINVVWCVPGGGGSCSGYFKSPISSENVRKTGREVIDVPLPQQDYVPTLPPPPGPITTARTPSTFYISFRFFFLYIDEFLSIFMHA